MTSSPATNGRSNYDTIKETEAKLEAAKRERDEYKEAAAAEAQLFNEAREEMNRRGAYEMSAAECQDALEHAEAVFKAAEIQRKRAKRAEATLEAVREWAKGDHKGRGNLPAFDNGYGEAQIEVLALLDWEGEK